MKNYYIELIEKTAVENTLQEKVVVAPTGNRVPNKGDIEGFASGTSVESDMKYNLENILNNKGDSFHITSRGLGENNDELIGETSFNDIAREVAIKNNQEEAYDNNLNGIRPSIERRNKLSNAATLVGAGIGSALGGAAGLKLSHGSKKALLGGALAGLGASGLLSGAISKKVNDKNKQEYLNSLTEEQRAAINKTFNDYAERAAENINIHDSVGYQA